MIFLPSTFTLSSNLSSTKVSISVYFREKVVFSKEQYYEYCNEYIREETEYKTSNQSLRDKKIPKIWLSQFPWSFLLFSCSKPYKDKQSRINLIWFLKFERNIWSTEPTAFGNATQVHTNQIKIPKTSQWTRRERTRGHYHPTHPRQEYIMRVQAQEGQGTICYQLLAIGS